VASDQWFENTETLSVAQIVGLGEQYRTDSLICAIEACVLAKDEDEDADISEAELTVLAVEAMEREVNNGGFAQFFENDSWRFTPYLQDALSRIGAAKTGMLVGQAIDALGIGLLTESTDTSHYRAQMQAAIEKDEITDALDACDAKYYELGEDIAGLVFQYVKENLGQFS